MLRIHLLNHDLQECAKKKTAIYTNPRKNVANATLHQPSYHPLALALELTPLPSLHTYQSQSKHSNICPQPQLPSSIKSLNPPFPPVLFPSYRPHCPHDTCIASHRHDRLRWLCHFDLRSPQYRLQRQRNCQFGRGREERKEGE